MILTPCHFKFFILKNSVPCCRRHNTAILKQSSFSGKRQFYPYIAFSWGLSMTRVATENERCFNLDLRHILGLFSSNILLFISDLKKQNSTNSLLLAVCSLVSWNVISWEKYCNASLLKLWSAMLSCSGDISSCTSLNIDKIYILRWKSIICNFHFKSIFTELILHNYEIPRLTFRFARWSDLMPFVIYQLIL